MVTAYDSMYNKKFWEELIAYFPKSKLCYDRRSISQYVLASSTHLGLTTRFLLLSDSCGFVHVGAVSDVYNCCWSSPAQSFSGLSPAGLVTLFYCLRFKTSSTRRAWSPYLYPPGTGWPSSTPRHRVPFSSPPTTRRARVEVFQAASTRAPTFLSPYIEYVTTWTA
jgi:hypothetical protein